MQRELVRIGIDRPAGYAVGVPADWASEAMPVTEYPRMTHRDMALALAEDPTLPMLDLRRNSEVENGYVIGAKLVPLHELRPRMTEILAWATSAATPVWIYCGSGFRAAIGASMLSAEGVPVVHVDDDFANAAPAGLTIVTPGHGERLGSTYTD